MQPMAAGDATSAYGAWVYLVIFAATTAGYAGVPAVGATVIGLGAVLASQGELNIAAVLVVAVIGCEAGGIIGYRVGDRWGRRLLEHAGPALKWRQQAVVKGEHIYARWGRAAVFVTPSLVSGTLKMNFRQFVFWNFLAGAAFVLSVGPAAYGAGRVSAGHHDVLSLGMLAGGIAVAAVCAALIVRYRHRRRARSAPSGATAVAGSSRDPR